MSDKPKKMSNFVGFTIVKQEEYIKTVDADLTNLFEYLDRFPRRFTQADEPTIQRNTHAFWKDSDNGKIYLLADFEGTTKKVELT